MHFCTYKLQSKYNVDLKLKNTDESFSIDPTGLQFINWFNKYGIVFLFFYLFNRIPTAILHERVAVDASCYLIFFSLKFPYKTLHVFLQFKNKN